MALRAAAGESKKKGAGLNGSLVGGVVTLLYFRIHLCLTVSTSLSLSLYLSPSLILSLSLFISFYFLSLSPSLSLFFSLSVFISLFTLLSFSHSPPFYIFILSLSLYPPLPRLPLSVPLILSLSFSLCLVLSLLLFFFPSLLFFFSPPSFLPFISYCCLLLLLPHLHTTLFS